MTDRELIAQAEESFAEWLRREMPPDTYIADPDWWAPRIYRAVCKAQAKQPAEQGEPVAPVLIALAWSKARNAWMQASRHGTQEAADLLAIAELTHYLAIPDPRIAALTELLREALCDLVHISAHSPIDTYHLRKRIEAALGKEGA